MSARTRGMCFLAWCWVSTATLTQVGQRTVVEVNRAQFRSPA